ncbi:glycosyltransferase [Desulfovibrio inopinatus]|uniref:glycosyltransferase n=1 Tax=Desulfovibrio inopinatus TaxID=102109 RepID=UPI0004018591|nr:glycosyltransferase [Desulfovibrio inopinatus]
MIDVSVVIPVRNSATSLKHAVSSVLHQTGVSFEIVIVDDGSNDQGATRAEIETLAHDTPCIKPIWRSHEGISSALNAGIAASSGRFIARMDADDISLPGRLHLQSQYLNCHPDIGLVGCHVAFGGDKTVHAGYAAHVDWTNRIVTPHDIRLALFRESPLPHPSVMFRKALVDRFGGYRHGDFPEDYELWLRWSEAGVSMAKVEETLLVWNDPPDRLSRSCPRYAPERFYTVKAACLARWLRHNNRHHPTIFVWGAGKASRARAEMLVHYGITIQAYIDIDDKKIGNIVQGRPVVGKDAIPAPKEGFIVSFVGSRGGGELVQEWLCRHGAIPGRHFILAS